MSSTSPAPSPSLPLLLYFIGVSASADSSFLLTFDEEKGKDSSSLGAEVKVVMQPCPESHWNWLLSVPFDEYTRHLTVLHGVCPRWTAKISSIAPERTLILPKAVVAASVGASEAAPASEPEPVDSPHISDYPPEMIVKDIAELKKRVLEQVSSIVHQCARKRERERECELPSSGRNPRHCPPWLAEVLDSCFVPVPPGRVFPAILDADKDVFLSRLRSWNFTSLGAGVEEMLLLCWWVFVDLGLVNDVEEREQRDDNDECCSGRTIECTNAGCIDNCNTKHDCSTCCNTCNTCNNGFKSNITTTTSSTTTTSTSINAAVRANPDCLKRFLLAVSVNYSPMNPYHNLHHVVDVLQCCYYWLHELLPELLGMLSSDWVMSIVLACLCHDLGHSSFGNAFLSNIGHPLCQMFGSRSVLEHQHSMILSALLRQPALDPLWGVERERKQRIRERVVECVMATDMSTHFDFITRFKSNFLEAETTTMLKKTLASASASTSKPATLNNSVTLNSSNSPLLSDRQSLLIAAALVKCSDISNVCRPFPIAKQWGHALLSEFLHQGDFERSLGLALGPLNDRSTLNVAEGQRGFLQKVAGPLYLAFAEQFPGIEPILTQLRLNYDEWGKECK